MTLAGAIKHAVGTLFPGIILVHGPRGGGMRIALTFDDGPHVVNTPRILAVLREARVRATFFVSGSQARASPNLLRQIDRSGHELGNHGYAHLSAHGMSRAEYVRHVIDTHRLLEAIVGRPLPRLFRPPYGDITVATFLSLAARGFQFVYWTTDSNDSFVNQAGEVASTIASKTIAPGSILLFHEDQGHTVTALPTVIEHLKGLGCEFVAISELRGADSSNRASSGERASQVAAETPESSNGVKPRIKRGIARALAPTGAFELMGGLRRALTDELVILGYHRICDPPDEERYPFDPELISASPEDFAWQMEYVKEHFNAVTFARLIEHIEHGTPLPPRPIIITFDDGFRDNYANAFPVLRRLGIPATIFLSTGYLDNREPFWFEWIAYLVFRLPASQLALPDGTRLELGANPSSRRRAVGALSTRMKTMDNAERLETLRWLQRAYERIVRAEDEQLSEPLTWEEVAEMSNAGIEFGSHGVSHPILSNVEDVEQLRSELLNSKHAIELRTGKLAQVLAYPVGSPATYNERTIEIAKQCGYKVGVAYTSGINTLADLRHYELARIHVERNIDRAGFRAMLGWLRLQS
jgi:peptidoglycan/xylan/chitin deacetylase (PgdA/CDA1 family)